MSGASLAVGQTATLDAMTDANFATGLAVADAGGMVYAPVGGGITIVDVTDPTQPRITGTITASLSLDAVVVVGATLVAGGQDRLLLYDLADAQHPRQVGEHLLRPPSGNKLGGLTELFDGGGTSVWACVWSTPTVDSGLPSSRLDCQAIDLSDPALPRQTGAFGDFSAYRHETTGLTAGSEYAVRFNRESVIGGSVGTITGLDVRQPERTVELGHWSVGMGSFGRAQIIGHWLYVDSFYYFGDFRPPDRLVGHLRIFDLLALADGQVAELLDTTLVAPMAVAGPRAYSVGDRLTLLDVSRPERPEVRGWLPVPGKAEGLAADGSRAYLLAFAGWRRLYVVDAADPWHPVLTGMVELAPRPDDWRSVVLPVTVR
jgi:hypothetical protein